jgi:NitT/TauT family transport system substrate-binding protein
VTKHSGSGSFFRSQKFTDFASVKESLVARETDAVFILVPMAMRLRQDGVPVKVVYLGHRDGTALIVDAKSDVRSVRDLAGKVCAIPSRFANQNLLMHRLMKDHGMAPGSIEMREVPPPEHPSALRSGSVDAYIVGEPFAAQAEVGGYGRVLYHTKDIWPEFISCVLVVREELIQEDRAIVQELVDGIAKSGKWLDEGEDGGLAHRMDAAQVTAEHYYFQDPELLKYVLSKPMDRVKYTNLAPLKDDLDEIMELGAEIGILNGPIAFEEYADDSFVRPLSEIDWEMDRLPAEGTTP